MYKKESQEFLYPTTESFENPFTNRQCAVKNDFQISHNIVSDDLGVKYELLFFFVNITYFEV